MATRVCHRTSNQSFQPERPELTSAPIVISGGRGMQDGTNFAAWKSG